MEAPELRFDRFEKKIHLKASLERIYHCWSTIEGLRSWFLSNATYTTDQGVERLEDETVKAGDSYTWYWHNWDGKEQGTVLETNQRDLIRFTFGEVSEVSVQLVQQENTVLLTLLQEAIPTDEKNLYNVFYGCSNGWTFWLTNLKAYLEHHILLNETEVDLRDDPSAGFDYVNI